MLKIKDKGKIPFGKFTVKIFDGERVVMSRDFDNMITNAGLAHSAAMLASSTAFTNTHLFAIGTDGAATTAGMTELVAQHSTFAVTTNTSLAAVSTFQGRSAALVGGPIAVKEVGFFTGAASAVMFSRQSETDNALINFQVLTGQVVEITWTITQSRP